MLTTTDNSASLDESTVPRSVSRVLDLLEVVLAERNGSLTVVAGMTGLTPTTALRYLRALEIRGYVNRDASGDFSAGPTMLRIAASLGRSSFLDRLRAVVQPHLDRLCEYTGESTYLAVSDGRTATYIATSESSRAIRHVGWVGQDVTLNGSALGTALLDPGTVATRTGAVEPDTTAMSRGLATTGQLEVAVSVVGPAHRFTGELRNHHEKALNEVVEDIERELRINGEDLTS
jgi:DNA-binding IclR family transcriptional regulator